MALGIIGGVAASSWAGVAGLLGGLLVAAIGWTAWSPWLLWGVAIGGLRLLSAPLVPDASDISRLAGQSLLAEGRIESWPEQRGAQQRVVATMSSGEYSGKALVYATTGQVLLPGDRVRLRGRLELPPPLAEFDYRKYLAKDGVYSLLYRAEVERLASGSGPRWLLVNLRRVFQSRLQRLFSEPESSFLLGILLGQRDGLPTSLESAFQRTGTIHVLALSGYNISVLVAVMVGLLGRTRSASLLAIGLIVTFVIFVGPSASVVRAAAMGGFILLATAFGRPQLAVLACLITAAGMLLANPWSLRYDLGFDLSFAGTLGILFFAEPLADRLAWLPRLLQEPVGATLAATLSTLPIIVGSFGLVSLASPLANAAVVPVIPWLMLGGFTATAADLMLPGLGQGLALLTQTACGAVVALVEFLAALPWAAVDGRGFRVPLVLASLAILLFAGWHLRREARG